MSLIDAIKSRLINEWFYAIRGKNNMNKEIFSFKELTSLCDINFDVDDLKILEEYCFTQISFLQSMDEITVLVCISSLNYLVKLLNLNYLILHIFYL